jgi:hypothetical protein
LLAGQLKLEIDGHGHAKMDACSKASQPGPG